MGIFAAGESKSQTAAPSQRRVYFSSPDRPRPRTPRVIYGIVLLTVLLSIFLSYAYFHFSPVGGMEVPYLFQAKLFAQGRLAAPAPPEMGLSPATYNNVSNGKVYSKYFFGNSLLLALGVLIGAPWLIPALATGAAVLILYQILREIYDPRTALLGALLALISPATLVTGAVLDSEAVSRLFLGLFLLCTIGAILRKSGFYAALSGLALAYAFNTRPLTAAVFGLVGAAFWLYRLKKREEKPAPLIRRAALCALFFLPGPLLMVAWNTSLTGHPLQSTYNASEPHDRLGFGPRKEGYYLGAGDLVDYTPQKAFERALTKVIPGVGFNSLGWGYYHPNINQWLLSGTASSKVRLGLMVLPAFLPFLLMSLPLLAPNRSRYDVLLFALPVLNLAFYFFNFGDGATWGNTPTETRYYNECTMFGILPLVARGLLMVWDWLRERSRGPAFAAAVGLLLMANTAYTYAHFQWHRELWVLDHQVRTRPVHHAVIFVPGTMAPVGDYPFQSLRDADVVYFRLGPSKIWGLPPVDPGEIYRKYFQGRQAFVFRDGNLAPLDLGQSRDSRPGAATL